MKRIVLLLTLIAASASAEIPTGQKLISCKPAQIDQFPENMEVDVVQTYDGKLYVITIASFYGVTLPNVFEVTSATTGLYLGKNTNPQAESVNVKLELKKSGKGKITLEPGVAELLICN